MFIQTMIIRFLNKSLCHQKLQYQDNDCLFLNTKFYAHTKNDCFLNTSLIKNKDCFLNKSVCYQKIAVLRQNLCYQSFIENKFLYNQKNVLSKQ